MANFFKMAVVSVVLMALVVSLTRADDDRCDASSPTCKDVGAAKKCCENNGGPAGCCANIQNCTDSSPSQLSACGEFSVTSNDGSDACTDGLQPCFDKSAKVVCCGSSRE